MLHEVAHLLGIALGAKPGVELPCQLVHVVADVVNLSTELPQLLRGACFQLRPLDQQPQIGCFTEAAGFGVLPELLCLRLAETQADFIVLRWNSSFLPPRGDIGVRGLPASGAKDIFARCLRTLAAGEGKLRRWVQTNSIFSIDKMRYLPPS